MNQGRIYLSPPNFSEEELKQVAQVIEDGWLAPIGPSIDAFEAHLSGYYGDKKVLALNSGTSALHLALILAGVEDGDHVLVSSFTFAACANVILYERAIPIFLDSEKDTWNLDPQVLEHYLANADVIPKAIIVTHLYGMPAKIHEIVSVANRYGVKVIEDAAEAFGAQLDGLQVGGIGDFGILSFNGNKIITTTSGGALICDVRAWERGKHLATQANSGVSEYDHKEAGYNYRMSNLLAGVGLAQLSKLDTFLKRKRSIFSRYKDHLGEHFDFLNEPANFSSNRWLTTATLKDEDRSVTSLIEHLDMHAIESRRLWKPLHLHEAYANSHFEGTGVCQELFEKGICLPSGTGLTDDLQDFVIARMLDWFA